MRREQLIDQGVILFGGNRGKGERDGSEAELEGLSVRRLLTEVAEQVEVPR